MASSSDDDDDLALEPMPADGPPRIGDKHVAVSIYSDWGPDVPPLAGIHTARVMAVAQRAGTGDLLSVLFMTDNAHAVSIGQRKLADEWLHAVRTAYGVDAVFIENRETCAMLQLQLGRDWLPRLRCPVYVPAEGQRLSDADDLGWITREDEERVFFRMCCMSPYDSYLAGLHGTWMESQSELMATHHVMATQAAPLWAYPRVREPRMALDRVTACAAAAGVFHKEAAQTS